MVLSENSQPSIHEHRTFTTELSHRFATGRLKKGGFQQKNKKNNKLTSATVTADNSVYFVLFLFHCSGIACIK